MAYIDQSLAPSEAVLYRARFPWYYRASAWACLIALCAFGVGVYAHDHGGIAVGAALMGLVLFLAIMTPIWTTEIGVTSQRLVFKRGLLLRHTQELQLRGIEEVNLEQGLLGRLLDYGQVELRGTGVDDIRLPSLADPLGLRKALQEGRAAAVRPVAASPQAVAHPAT